MFALTESKSALALALPRSSVRHSEGGNHLIRSTAMTLEKDPGTDAGEFDIVAIAEATVGLPLNISVSCGAGSTRVALAGELDDATAGFLHVRMCAVVAELPGDLSIDLGLLTFIDSTGLSLLVTLHKRVEALGATLTVVDPTPMARRLFQITGLDKILRIEPAA
jgi:anti-sigma B factor antagonist